MILGAIVGLILHATAVLALTLHGWMFGDDTEGRKGQSHALIRTSVALLDTGRVEPC